MAQQTNELRGGKDPQYEVIIIGAGVGGIYQLYRLPQLGVERHRARSAPPTSAAPGTGTAIPGAASIPRATPTATRSRRSCCDEWHWKERFSGQPENLRYLNYVADKFDLRKHMQFNCVVSAREVRRGAQPLARCACRTAAS